MGGDKWRDPESLADYYREKADELRDEGRNDEADSYDSEANRMDQIQENLDYGRSGRDDVSRDDDEE